jgi:hypothetical protein
MLYWEADERQPSNWDNVASTPDEGVTQRHNMGSVMGMFGGPTEYMKFKNYYREAGIGGFPGVRPGASGATQDRNAVTELAKCDHAPGTAPTRLEINSTE